MKPGLSLRVSQHLALTPQLQQSIRLLQLSTLELSQEVSQMLDENPFLEVTEELPPREEFGLEQIDTPVRQADREAELSSNAITDTGPDLGSSSNDDGVTPLTAADAQSWDGDGTQEIAPDDNEWGGDAKAHGNNLGGDDEVDAGELARTQESLQASRNVEEFSRYALTLPPQTDKRAADALVANLKKFGVNDVSALNDNGISLGVFSTEDAALRLVADLKSKAPSLMTALQVTPRSPQPKETVFTVREPDTNIVAKLTLKQREFDGSHLRAVTCPTAPPNGDPPGGSAAKP